MSQVVHRALAGGGNLAGQRLRQRAEHDIGDALRGLDVAAATAAGGPALTSEFAGASTRTGAKQPAFIGTSSSIRQRVT
jgi:hypothetical protein